jgi:hypothetical protein
MNTAVLPIKNSFLLDNYWGLIKNLDREQKIQLAARLTHEIAEADNSPADPAALVDRFCGAWQSVQNADKIAAEIRSGRTFTRTIESL